MTSRERHQAVMAEVGDLAVGKLLTGACDWCVLTVAGVDAEGAVTQLTDTDDRKIAVYRIFDLADGWFIAKAWLLTEEGRQTLPGTCAPGREALKPAFRRYFAGGRA